MLSAPHFLDVEEADQPLVRKHFPDAVFIDHTLRGPVLIDALRDAEIVSTFITTSFPRDVIEQLSNLKLLATRSVGYDHIDLDACKEKGITVCNVPDYGSHVIAEHVFALLLGTLRHIDEGNRRVESGVFDYRGLRGMALQGKTIGIAGTGKIGRCVAKIAHGFGMKLLGTDMYRVASLESDYGLQYVPLEELLEKSDIISLHLPSTKDTEHVIDAQAFARMKDGVVLVNTARGSLIDSAALLKAVQSGKVGYALLDVVEHEQDIAAHRELVAHRRVIMTPHIAFYADDSMRNMYMDCFQSIEQWRTGKEPEHVVRPVGPVTDLPAIKHQ